MSFENGRFELSPDLDPKQLEDMQLALDEKFVLSRRMFIKVATAAATGFIGWAGLPTLNWMDFASKAMAGEIPEPDTAGMDVRKEAIYDPSGERIGEIVRMRGERQAQGKPAGTMEEVGATHIFVRDHEKHKVTIKDGKAYVRPVEEIATFISRQHTELGTYQQFPVYVHGKGNPAKPLQLELNNTGRMVIPTNENLTVYADFPKVNSFLHLREKQNVTIDLSPEQFAATPVKNPIRLHQTKTAVGILQGFEVSCDMASGNYDFYTAVPKGCAVKVHIEGHPERDKPGEKGMPAETSFTIHGQEAIGQAKRTIEDAWIKHNNIKDTTTIALVPPVRKAKVQQFEIALEEFGREPKKGGRDGVA